MRISKYILFLLTILLSCKKETSLTIIEGKVINAGSKIPIDSVLVTLQDGIGSANTIGSHQSTTTYTDKDGYFKISMKCEAPFLWLTKKGYEFVVMNEGAGQSVKGYYPGLHKNEILGLWAQAYFNASFIGLNCTSTDTSVIGADEGNHVPLAWIKIGIVFTGKGPHFGNLSNNGLYAWGDKYFPYWIVYQIQGTWHEKVDSVYIKSFTTYTDTIYY